MKRKNDSISVLILDGLEIRFFNGADNLLSETGFDVKYFIKIRSASLCVSLRTLICAWV